MRATQRITGSKAHFVASGEKTKYPSIMLRRFLASSHLLDDRLFETSSHDGQKHVLQKRGDIIKQLQEFDQLFDLYTPQDSHISSTDEILHDLEELLLKQSVFEMKLKRVDGTNVNITIRGEECKKEVS